MWSIFAASFGVIFYILLQATVAGTQPLKRALIDVLVSLIPFKVIVYTAIDWIRSGTSPSNFQSR